MSDAIKIHSNFPVVDYIGTGYEEKPISDIETICSTRWTDLFRALRPIKFKIKSIRNKLKYDKVRKSLKHIEVWNIVDFNRFKSIINVCFPGGNQKAFLGIAFDVFGASFAGWTRILIGNSGENGVVALNNVMSHFLYSIVYASYEYRKAVENEKLAPEVDDLESDVGIVFDCSNRITSVLKRIDKRLFERAVKHIVQNNDESDPVLLQRRKQFENWLFGPTGLSEGDSSAKYITSMEILSKMMEEIDVELK